MSHTGSLQDCFQSVRRGRATNRERLILSAGGVKRHASCRRAALCWLIVTVGGLRGVQLGVRTPLMWPRPSLSGSRRGLTPALFCVCVKKSPVKHQTVSLILTAETPTGFLVAMTRYSKHVISDTDRVVLGTGRGDEATPTSGTFLDSNRLNIGPSREAGGGQMAGGEV